MAEPGWEEWAALGACPARGGGEASAPGLGAAGWSRTLLPLSQGLVPLIE